MKLKSIALSLFLGCFFACQQQAEHPKDADTQIENINVTPDILIEGANSSTSDILSYKKRAYANLIEQLYAEALEKNKKLRDINERIKNIPYLHADSLKSYTDFQRNNTRYYVDANRHIAQVKDSLVRVELLNLLNSHQENFSKSMENHTRLLAEINRKSNQLNEDLLLMKFLISEKMMHNYQINEKPDIRALQNLNKAYDELLEDTKEFSTVQK